ncbi:hypothetical protein P7K49_029132 [Saguinus oedipus]|uniref:CB1 cannabinoid receptor-interacting protein 1 n=1 Tax=Saguinus oedipus TaxID=9490 RepID=A0ABQ9U745_SAGOE|nr:hypothetical protein P7K49_029132 [Saguinus oedipus]
MWSTQVYCRNISIGGVLVPLELKSKEPDGDRVVYTGTYDTEGVTPTKSGERQPIQITMPNREKYKNGEINIPAREQVYARGLILVQDLGDDCFLKSGFTCDISVLTERGRKMASTSLPIRNKIQIDDRCSNQKLYDQCGEESTNNQLLLQDVDLSTNSVSSLDRDVFSSTLVVKSKVDPGLQLDNEYLFTDIGTFETVWQVKFYNYHKRDHCQWGSPFSVIEYECKPNETRSLMWVNKESFL